MIIHVLKAIHIMFPSTNKAVRHTCKVFSITYYIPLHGWIKDTVMCSSYIRDTVIRNTKSAVISLRSIKSSNQTSHPCLCHLISYWTSQLLLYSDHAKLIKKETYYICIKECQVKRIKHRQIICDQRQWGSKRVISQALVGYRCY